MTTIGFIGAGQLGEPMVHRLVAAGQPTAVYARRDDVRVRLRGAGAVLADSAAELAAASDILICCLFSDAQLRETAMGPAGFIAHMQRGAIFVSHTTGSVGTLRELAENSPSTTVLDAPVSGTADDIAHGTLTVLLGGASDAVQRVRPILAAYADPIVCTGTLGSAMAMKLINNVLFAANAQLVAAAVQIGERLGVSSEALLSALTVCSANSNAASYAQGAGGIEAFVELAAPFLRKDVAAAVAAAEDAGADLGFLRSVVETGPLSLA
jgi:3-hydroxyisobutyrate dehydrogenase-like beta-hydroxyacid dehydrogenase